MIKPFILENNRGLTIFMFYGRVNMEEIIELKNIRFIILRSFRFYSDHDYDDSIDFFIKYLLLIHFPCIDCH